MAGTDLSRQTMNHISVVFLSILKYIDIGSKASGAEILGREGVSHGSPGYAWWRQPEGADPVDGGTP
jgi:hypothetical protein